MKAWAALALRVILVAVLARATTAQADGELLRTLIDQRLKPVAGLEPVYCSDAEFLRRVSLDLIGMPPTADETRSFLTDTAADKRERLVDRLLSSPHYTRHMAASLDLMLMERRPNTHVSVDEWQGWLLKSLQENKPWNVLAREILLADGDDPAQRPAARFFLDRASEPNVLARDIGRVFFGRDMQCAQCHDHPLIDDYLQSDYHGLLAFVAPGYAVVRKEGDKQFTVHAEKAGGDLKFESVFVKGTRRRTGPRAPDDLAIDEPFFLPGDEYQVAPAENVKSVPKFSRRAKLAELATNGANQAFNRNIANRLWAHMFGRGLVHPPDLHHAGNPATDPQLLQLLGERFAAMKFDMKGFLRELALSGAYQRSFDVPASGVSLSSQAAAEVTQLEQQRAVLDQAAKVSREAFTKAIAAWHQAEAATLPATDELDAARNQYAEAKKKVDEAAKALADATAQLQAKQNVAAPVQQAATAAQQAVQALAEDKELAEAAGKFVAKSAQLAAEVAALTKAVEEKTAALQPPTAALNTVKTTIDAALAKIAPLTTTLKSAEQAMLSARRQAAADSEALAAFDRRLATVRRIAQLPELNQAIATANQAVTIRQAELAAAGKQLTDYAAVVALNEANVKTATDAMTAATNTLNAARTEHAKRTELAQAIATAFASADAARQKAADDPVLTDVAAKLKQRADVAQSAAGESQKQVESATAAEKSAVEALAAAQKSLSEAAAERTRREQAVAAANAAFAAAQADVSAKQSVLNTAVADVADRWAGDFTVASLKPLTPEQLCWSIFRVTGVYDRHWQAEVAELDKSKPLTDEQKQDPAQLAARNIELEQKTFNKLKGSVGTFVAFYGAAAGQPQGDFFATADQALFAANGGAINVWVAPAGDNVTERIIKQTDLRAAAQELYLGVLTRLPTEDETTEVVTHLTSREQDKDTAAQELVWGLLNSAEFRFNH